MKYRVLVADDEKLIAKNIAKSIEQINPCFEIAAICTDGKEALEYIAENPVHVVFTDIRMPEMDGLELAKHLFLDHPYIQCVIISGYNDFDYARSAISYQVKNYLLKPINKEELRKCLSEIETHLHTALTDLETVATQEKSTEELVCLVKEYVQKNYQHTIDLSAMADTLGFSSAYLTKIFTKHEGMPPSKYIKKYRLTIARQLLLTTDIPIAVIAEQTGFNDQFHFSKTFKAAEGLSPSEYRQKRPLT